MSNCATTEVVICKVILVQDGDGDHCTTKVLVKADGGLLAPTAAAVLRMAVDKGASLEEILSRFFGGETVETYDSYDDVESAT